MTPDTPANTAANTATHVRSLFQQGLALHRQGKFGEAEAIYEAALRIDSQHFDTLNMLGTVAAQTGRFDIAVERLQAAIKINASFAPSHNNLGMALLNLRRLDEACASFANALALRADFVDCHENRGLALLEMNRPREALASFDRVLNLDPNRADAHFNRGRALMELRQPAEALASEDRALALKPDHAAAHNIRGNALMELKRPEEALFSYDRALALKPHQYGFHTNRANALLELKRLEDALASFRRGLALNPDTDFLFGSILDLKLKLCDWAELDADIATINAGIPAGKRLAPPFSLLMLIDDPKIHQQATKIFVDCHYPPRSDYGTYMGPAKGSRVRIGYYSSDFNDHPGGHLMARLFACHDPSKFEVFAFSFGPPTNSAIRTRIESSVDSFLDVRDATDDAIVRMSRELGIEIAIDVNGLTKGGRTGIFASRTAPVQVSFGHPGTMEASYMDYIIADEIVIPRDCQNMFAEKVVYLPNCYLLNGTKDISGKPQTRQDAGLPTTGFVFCCFSQSNKILPHVFGIWMRLLKAVEGSVLWLREEYPEVTRNLQKAAEARGVDRSRLVFAPRAPLDEHMARHRLADLFLDTVPYNAATTAGDALWAGLPVLTCQGVSFASRVAASVLHAAGLPELITSSLPEYEAQALALATDRSIMARIKAALSANRSKSPLFDAKLFARHIESAYTTMHDRYRCGLAPASIDVR